jgi:hypothetical protein
MPEPAAWHAESGLGVRPQCVALCLRPCNFCMPRTSHACTTSRFRVGPTGRARPAGIVGYCLVDFLSCPAPAAVAVGGALGVIGWAAHMV